MVVLEIQATQKAPRVTLPIAREQAVLGAGWNSAGIAVVDV